MIHIMVPSPFNLGVSRQSKHFGSNSITSFTKVASKIRGWFGRGNGKGSKWEEFVTVPFPVQRFYLGASIPNIHYFSRRNELMEEQSH